jgi:hypothetical protein
LKREGGGVVESEEELGPFISNFYKILFMSSAGPVDNKLLEHIPQTVTPEMNEKLTRPFTGQEVKEALDSIGDLKAPGPDGMPAVFYKRFWDIIGDRVTEEVLQVLNGGELPADWNETCVALIPKVKNPDCIKNMRPISLCNVVYKIISKVLAKRLKVLLPEIISPAQSAFVPGRLLTDNVLLAYEVIHYMRNKRQGKEAFAAVS